MEHSFNISIAEKFGIEEAIFLHNLYFWLHKNAANGKMFIDGSYWTFNSKKAYTRLFPYMNIEKIKRIISKLKNEDIIKAGNYNENKFDQTKWYAFTDKGLQVMNDAGYDMSDFKINSEEKQEDAVGQNEPSCKVKMNQCNKDINKTDINNKETLETSSRVRERLSHKYNKDKPLTDIEVKFYLGMEEKYPRVMHMDYPLLYRQYQELLNKGVNNNKIIANLEAMENYKPLKDRVKAYQTLLNFIKIDKNTYAPTMA